MTAIPYDTHMQIKRAIQPLMEPIYAAFRAKTGAQQLSYHAAKVRLDTEPTIWYYKDTPIEIAFSRSTGFILLDHVRKLRSPGINSLSDAMRAREHTLKEHENARSQHAEVDASDGGHEATADRDQAQV